MNVSWRAISCVLLRTVGKLGMEKSLFFNGPEVLGSFEIVIILSAAFQDLEFFFFGI